MLSQTDPFDPGGLNAHVGTAEQLGAGVFSDIIAIVELRIWDAEGLEAVALASTTLTTSSGGAADKSRIALARWASLA